MLNHIITVNLWFALQCTDKNIPALITYLTFKYDYNIQVHYGMICIPLCNLIVWDTYAFVNMYFYMASVLVFSSVRNFLPTQSSFIATICIFIEHRGSKKCNCWTNSWSNNFVAGCLSQFMLIFFIASWCAFKNRKIHFIRKIKAE